MYKYLITIALLLFLSGCIEENSENIDSIKEEIKTWTYGVNYSQNVGTFIIEIIFANNATRLQSANIGVKVVVSTDNVADGQGDEFAYFFQMDCMNQTNCNLPDFFHTSSYSNIPKWCCINTRNYAVSYFTNKDGYVVLKIRGIPRSFTKTTYDNLLKGQVKTNVVAVLFSDSSKNNIISQDFFPDKNIYTSQLGTLIDEKEDYIGSSNLIDIKEVNIILNPNY